MRNGRNGTMTATEMIPAVGQRVSVALDGLIVRVTVLDVRQVYGKPQLLITPTDGAGQRWIDISRLRTGFDIHGTGHSQTLAMEVSR